MYVAPDKKRPGLKARRNTLRAQYEVAAKVRLAQENAEALAKVAKTIQA